MIWVETAAFLNKRRKLKRRQRESLQQAVFKVRQSPLAGKPLKGEFRELRVLSYSSKGQPKRLVYLASEDQLVLISFGP
jgi:hypothetical protein